MTTINQTFATAAQEYGDVGAAFGSSLGRILANNSAFAQISASTVLGALGEQVAAAIGVGVNGADAAQTIDTFLNGATAGPNGSVIGNGGFLDSLESQGAGAVAAYLIGELVSAIGLTGAPAQIVDSIGGQTVSQIADNIIEHGFSSWSNGIGNVASLENLAGGFIGTELGNLVYSASTVQGSEGASVGSAVGGAVGALPFGISIGQSVSEAIFGTAIPGFGVLLGALVGDIIGGLIGDLFGQTHITQEAEANIAVTTSGSAATSTWGYNASDPQVQDAKSIGEDLTASLDSILTDVGGTITNLSSLTRFGVGFNADAGPGTDAIGVDETNGGYCYYYDDQTTGIRYQYWAQYTSLEWVMDYAEAHELSEMQFSGGDPYMVRAIDAAMRSAQDPAMTTVTGDIQIAKDYETYEENRAVINALMAASPTSDFTIGWIAELAIAGEMGYGTSVQGGAGNDSLAPDASHKILIGGGGNDTYNISQGNGAVTILNGISTDNTIMGVVSFGAGFQAPNAAALTSNFRMAGNDLVVSFAGSTDQVTIEGWASGWFEQVNAFDFANGTIVAGSDVNLAVGEAYYKPIEGGQEQILVSEIGPGVAGLNDFSNSSTTINGGMGEDVLSGGAANNTFVAGGGDDEAIGNGGYDTYVLNNTGQLTIMNGVAGANSPSGELDIGAGITADQLTFTDYLGCLVITTPAWTSSATVMYWFVDPYAQLTSIKTTADGVSISYNSAGYLYGMIPTTGTMTEKEEWNVTDSAVTWTTYKYFTNTGAGTWVTQADKYSAARLLTTQVITDNWEVASPATYTINLLSTAGDLTPSIAGDGLNFLGDGGHDIFERSSDPALLNQLVVYEFGAGNTSVARMALTNTAGNAVTLGAYWSVLGADVNLLGFGGSDVIEANSSSGVTVYEFGTNGVVLHSATIYAAGTSTQVTAPAGTSFIGTGYNFLGQSGQDAIWRNATTGQVGVWEFTTASNKTSVTAGPALVTASGAAIDNLSSVVGSGANFLGDGGKDLFVRNSAGNLVVDEFNSAGTELATEALTNTAGASIGFSGAATVIGAGVGLLNGVSDTNHDVLVRLATTGQLAIWEFGSSGQETGAVSLTLGGAALDVAAGTSVVGTCVTGGTQIELAAPGASPTVYDITSSVAAQQPAGTTLTDPLVVNLSGGAVTTQPLATDGVVFDMLGDGAQQQTGWIADGEGFLVTDPTGSGAVTSSAQMFSSLDALAAYDTNGDGVIDASDTNFGDIEVWQPGPAGSSGTLETLGQLGITAIGLQPAAIGTTDNGNQLLEGFNFQYADGTTGQGASVGFNVGPDLSTINGGGGGPSDTYDFEAGEGAVVIDNTANGATAPHGELDCGAGITEQNLWFAQSGNNLVIDYLGSKDSVTVQGWFGSNSGAQLSEIVGNDGAMISQQVQLQLLIQAMASFSADNSAFNPVTATQMPTDPGLQSVIAASWHY